MSGRNFLHGFYAFSLVVAGTTCTQRHRDRDDQLAFNELPGVWSVEFSSSHNSTTAGRPSVVFGTIILDSLTSTPNGNDHLVGTYHLDSANHNFGPNLSSALLGDGSCFAPSGRLQAYNRRDGRFDLSFTDIFDCDFVAQVRRTTLRGHWQYLLMGGTAAQGELRLSRPRR